MKQRVAKLLSVKSIVTIALTGVFCALALKGSITGAEFLTIFTTVIAFYFGVQSTKEKAEAKETENVKTGKDEE